MSRSGFRRPAPSASHRVHGGSTAKGGSEEGYSRLAAVGRSALTQSSARFPAPRAPAERDELVVGDRDARRAEALAQQTAGGGVLKQSVEESGAGQVQNDDARAASGGTREVFAMSKSGRPARRRRRSGARTIRPVAAVTSPG